MLSGKTKKPTGNLKVIPNVVGFGMCQAAIACVNQKWH